MNPLIFLLYPIFAIGATFLVILSLLLIFFLVKYNKTHKKKYLIFSICIILISAYASIDISLPRKGKVTNALDGNPVIGIEVLRVFQTTNIVLNPGGESSKPKWWQKVKTDNDGIYNLPISIHLKIPFLSSLSKITIGAPICDKGEFKFLPHCPWPFDSIMNFNNSKFENEYTDVSRLIGGDIYLIPKLNQIEKCDALIKKELSNECKSVNAIQAAIYNKNIKLCSYAVSAYSCIITTAAVTKDDKFCMSLNEDNSDRISCLRNVATEKKDKKICESIPNSRWLSDIDSLGNAVERCIESSVMEPVRIFDNNNLLPNR